MPLINLMDERIRTPGYVRIDETSLQVLKSEDASKSGDPGCAESTTVDVGSRGGFTWTTIDLV